MCQNPKCGKKVEWNKFHTDHIIPHSKGGETTINNGQVLCSSCNVSKQDKKNLGY
ncbi:MAG: HNH endonuclease [Promethearchaeota archaeon]